MGRPVRLMREWSVSILERTLTQREEWEDRSVGCLARNLLFEFWNFRKQHDGVPVPHKAASKSATRFLARVGASIFPYLTAEFFEGLAGVEVGADDDDVEHPSVLCQDIQGSFLKNGIALRSRHIIALVVATLGEDRGHVEMIRKIGELVTSSVLELYTKSNNEPSRAYRSVLSLVSPAWDFDDVIDFAIILGDSGISNYVDLSGLLCGLQKAAKLSVERVKLLLEAVVKQPFFHDLEGDKTDVFKYIRSCKDKYFNDFDLSHPDAHASDADSDGNLKDFIAYSSDEDDKKRKRNAMSDARTGKGSKKLKQSSNMKGVSNLKSKVRVEYVPSCSDKEDSSSSEDEETSNSNTRTKSSIDLSNTPNNQKSHSRNNAEKKHSKRATSNDISFISSSSGSDSSSESGNSSSSSSSAKADGSSSSSHAESNSSSDSESSSSSSSDGASQRDVRIVRRKQSRKQVVDSDSEVDIAA